MLFKKKKEKKKKERKMLQTKRTFKLTSETLSTFEFCRITEKSIVSRIYWKQEHLVDLLDKVKNRIWNKNIDII